MADPNWKPLVLATAFQPFEQLLDSEEAATLLKVHPKTLQRMARRGELPAHPFGDGRRKRWRFLLSELDVWIRARKNEPATRAA